jgi:hypothetical protein
MTKAHENNLSKRPGKKNLSRRTQRSRSHMKLNPCEEEDETGKTQKSS